MISDDVVEIDRKLRALIQNRLGLGSIHPDDLEVFEEMRRRKPHLDPSPLHIRLSQVESSLQSLQDALLKPLPM
jgi:hypothetical protein